MQVRSARFGLTAAKLTLSSSLGTIVATATAPLDTSGDWSSIGRSHRPRATGGKTLVVGIGRIQSHTLRLKLAHLRPGR
jgi:hypothetical protein